MHLPMWYFAKNNVWHKRGLIWPPCWSTVFNEAFLAILKDLTSLNKMSFSASKKILIAGFEFFPQNLTGATCCCMCMRMDVN